MRHWILLAVLCAACQPTLPATVIPTQPLMEPTATPTAIPLTATPTTALVLAADELATSGEAAATGEPGFDPLAAELVALAQARLAEELDLPTRRIRLVEVTPVTWTDTSLGCPLDGNTYAPARVEGYRVVLSAGDSHYIFHSDFDRLVPCDAENEALPEATVTAETGADPAG